MRIDLDEANNGFGSGYGYTTGDGNGESGFG